MRVGFYGVIVGPNIEQEIASPQMDFRIVWFQRDELLEVIERTVSVANHLEDFGPVEKGISIFAIEVDHNGEITQGLLTVLDASRRQATSIEILGDVLLTFFDGLVEVL